MALSTSSKKNGLVSVATAAQPKTNGRFPKGPMNDVYKDSMTTEGHHSVSETWLAMFGETDSQMDRWQEKAYVILARIMDDLTLSRQQIRSLAREAMGYFNQAEVWEALNERNVQDGHGALILARVSNRRVVSTSELALTTRRVS